MFQVYIYFCDPDEETGDEKYRKLLKERRLGELTDRKQHSKYSACDFVNPKAYDWLQTRNQPVYTRLYFNDWNIFVDFFLINPHVLFYNKNTLFPV